ncbi:MAG: hypothetical protein ACRDBO_04945, partial [Lachnospiraceae bacterium]
MKINRSGFITNYLVSGPRAVDFTNTESDSNQLRYEQYLRTIVADRELKLPEKEIALGGISELGLPWQYYYSYGNWFVDESTFYSILQKVELDAVTGLLVESDMEIPVVFWTYAAITVWCNEEKVCQIDTPVYKPIQKKKTVLRLTRGYNQIYIKLQTLGVRDTRTLFGIQLVGEMAEEEQYVGKQRHLQVILPDYAHTEPLFQIEKWLE